MNGFFIITNGKGHFAFKSVWAYVLGHEPIITTRTWEAMKWAIEERKRG
jgi:hypothetical protein